MYFPGETAQYNSLPSAEREPVVPALLEELKDIHSDSFGWALACCAWHQDQAEDVLQEAYLRVLDGRAVFGRKSSIKTWFFGVIRLVAADVKRSHTRHSLMKQRMVPEILMRERDTARQNSPPVEALHEGETSRQLRQALLQLSQRQREILHLVFYCELTLEEAAATVQVSVGSARTHYHRGKEGLLRLLSESDTYA